MEILEEGRCQLARVFPLAAAAAVHRCLDRISILGHFTTNRRRKTSGTSHWWRGSCHSKGDVSFSKRNMSAGRSLYRRCLEAHSRLLDRRDVMHSFDVTTLRR